MQGKRLNLVYLILFSKRGRGSQVIPFQAAFKFKHNMATMWDDDLFIQCSLYYLSEVSHLAGLFHINSHEVPIKEGVPLQVIRIYVLARIKRKPSIFLQSYYTRKVKVYRIEYDIS